MTALPMLFLKFPKKCTAIAARLNDNQELEVFIPFGIDDLVNFRVSPTPHYFSDKERQTVYNERVKRKIGIQYGQTFL